MRRFLASQAVGKNLTNAGNREPWQNPDAMNRDFRHASIGRDLPNSPRPNYPATVPAVKQRAFLLALPLVASLLWAGCGSDGGSNSKSSASNMAGDPPAQTNNNPSSFSGKTYSFTVMARQGLSEPVGATYSIGFTDSTYSFNPSPQNTERTNSVVAAYTYDPGTATVVLSGVSEDVTGSFIFTSPRSGTVHWMEPDGEMQDATFAEL
jgi:hypothetical protein